MFAVTLIVDLRPLLIAETSNLKPDNLADADVRHTG